MALGGVKRRICDDGVGVALGSFFTIDRWIRYGARSLKKSNSANVEKAPIYDFEPHATEHKIYTTNIHFQNFSQVLSEKF